MKILMVCLNNICRSPLAAGILKKILAEKEVSIQVDSAGFEPYHIGQKPNPRTLSVAKQHGIDLSGHRMRLFKVADFDEYDIIFVMDQKNYHDVIAMARNTTDIKKVNYILNVLSPGQFKIISDPNYSKDEDFEKIFNQLYEVCNKIAERVILQPSE